MAAAAREGSDKCLLGVWRNGVADLSEVLHAGWSLKRSVPGQPPRMIQNTSFSMVTSEAVPKSGLPLNNAARDTDPFDSPDSYNDMGNMRT